LRKTRVRTRLSSCGRLEYDMIALAFEQFDGSKRRLGKSVGSLRHPATPSLPHSELSAAGLASSYPYLMALFMADFSCFRGAGLADGWKASRRTRSRPPCDPCRRGPLPPRRRNLADRLVHRA